MSATSVVLAGRYRLDSRIAAGGVGEVWRATDTALSRPVAVKLLRAEYVQHREALARFRAEARHAGSLSHPGIARVYDYGEDSEPYPPYLVMELVDGPSLAELLVRGRLGPAHTMHVVAQTAAGLAAAHAAGLVHRDIKPANLLLSSTGQVKISDFGIAHAAGSAPLTRTGLLVGTPAYLAPERVAGASGTPAADLYALGVVAYECLAGAPPFSGEPIVVAAAHRDRPLPELPAAVPEGIAALVSDLTKKDPRARPGSAVAVAQRAAALSDAVGADGAAGERASWDFPVPAVPGGHTPGREVRAGAPAPAHTAAGPESSPVPARQVPGWGDLSRDWPVQSVALAVAAAALTAGLIGWLLAGLFFQASRPGAGLAAAPPAATSPAGPRDDSSSGAHGGARGGPPGRPHRRRCAAAEPGQGRTPSRACRDRGHGRARDARPRD